MPLNIGDWRQAFSEWDDAFANIGEDTEVRLAALVSINLADLQSTLVNHPSLYAYAASLYERAKIAETRAKADYEGEKSLAFKRMEAENPGLAIGKIDKMVEADDDVCEAREKYLDAQEKTAHLKAAVTSLEHRRDMLLQISANKRQEDFNTNAVR